MRINMIRIESNDIEKEAFFLSALGQGTREKTPDDTVCMKLGGVEFVLRPTRKDHTRFGVIVEVDDADRVVEQSAEFGCKILQKPKRQLGDWGRIAIIEDPLGLVHEIVDYKLKRNLVSAPELPQTHFSILIAASMERVFEALLSPEDLAKWYVMAPPKEIGRAPGERYDFGSRDSLLISGVIKEVHYGEKLVHSFQMMQGEQPVSNVSWTLSKSMGHTRVALLHDGMDLAGGWELLISSLKTYLETGNTMATLVPRE
ncbi:SRPBCC domain-containing protein [Roseibium album]|uniref:SRPBCC domain-containing protein n=1 Tax=Roseibium album TaxID=311410 RepID=UPI003BB0ED36